MKPTERLHNLGQSLWLDDITRESVEQRPAQILHQQTTRTQDEGVKSFVNPSNKLMTVIVSK